MQPLFWRLSFMVAAYGQYAGSPLLAPELCGYGGRVFGRAYDPSQLVGDSCLHVVPSHDQVSLTPIQGLCPLGSGSTPPKMIEGRAPLSPGQ